MNDEVKQHLIKYNESQGFGTDEADLIEVLRKAKHIYSEESSSHRWWDLYFVVVEIAGMLIGFIEGRTTGDESAEDKGWEFEPDTICIVEKKQRLVDYYEAIQ